MLLFVLEGRSWHAVFDTLSSLTTTGFSLDEPAGWSSTRKFFTTLWMIVGGSAGSTAGGLKLMRLIVIFKLLLSFEMWAGRLEILPVLVLVHPGTWKPRKRSR